MSSNRFGQDAALIAIEKFKSGRIDRRSFLTAMAGLGLAVAMRPGAASAEANEIVVCNWGGAALDAFQKAYGEPFTKKSSIPVVIDGAGPETGAIRAMVDSMNVTWDATDGGMTDALVLGKGGYVEPIDYSIVDKSLVGDGLAAEFGICNYTYSNVLAYDSKKLSTAPASWADFFDLEKFPGKRTMCKWIQGQLEAVLLADGVKPEDIYPLDVDRAFKKLEPLLPNLIFWESGAQSQQLFRDGEVVMGNIWHTRANLLRKENPQFTWTWNNNLMFASAWSVPKGNPAGKKVFDFINSSMEPEGQITLLRIMGNGPSNPKALALMTEEDKAVYSLAPENAKTGLKISAQYYADNEAALQNKFLDFISR
ncbi:MULTISPECIES: ABC transporter substrate-binding protein [unclassified Mesorhizobium]|uniref:ABC transporter substrate-binding protein n=1 Tax=unclassified Mesorhizobium TaxID=325217 RepID=UPI000F762BF2|nr:MULTISPECIES: ABC transporter substrate-binding protein [unclassified Mesorhizobium]AZO07194.1 ABC transporter substrate-binding protein [Mesorhizobium sp. M2A.F.Ca.ET.043.02.1.1]RUW41635.1 ABC transporter substrate-binding protein [Mesorhizobium sp. M2A.F.Ca.ET.015.02.1.1]RUW78071.1 ABC transporter substrate-binding protein [Mesorhizobium sp. M2A.F.Ca.ET.067.02.1.1]RVC95175.1 ABC transporter substrate-binding protein [Mesorhizobium sp. M2A.F.Ca.ET.017.03.2.1]RVD07862.1 ABC transporter subs